jgi:hypothetical protein
LASRLIGRLFISFSLAHWKLAWLRVIREQRALVAFGKLCEQTGSVRGNRVAIQRILRILYVYVRPYRDCRNRESWPESSTLPCFCTRVEHVPLLLKIYRQLPRSFFLPRWFAGEELRRNLGIWASLLGSDE